MEIIWIGFWTKYLFFLLPALVLGYVADLIFGDPQGIWHPICFIGSLISRVEKGIRRFLPKTTQGERLGGAVLVVVILFFSMGIPWVILLLAYPLHWLLGLILQSYMCYTILATKSLRVESQKVYRALKQQGLLAGREAVSMIVGRDTSVLDETGVVKATVETIAENTSDGVIAPLIFLALGGPILGYGYKAVNTMDSMIGYKNEKYRYFGTVAARLDDVLNFIPARISAVLLLGSGLVVKRLARLCGRLLPRGEEKDFGDCPVPGETREKPWRLLGQIAINRGFRIWRRDGRKHASPNSAQTEAVMAGLLGVELAGDAVYFGELHQKPTIGDAIRPVEMADIPRANVLMYGASLLGFLLCVILRLR